VPNPLHGRVAGVIAWRIAQRLSSSPNVSQSFNQKGPDIPAAWTGCRGRSPAPSARSWRECGGRPAPPTPLAQSPCPLPTRRALRRPCLRR